MSFHEDLGQFVLQLEAAVARIQAVPATGFSELSQKLQTLVDETLNKTQPLNGPLDVAALESFWRKTMLPALTPLAKATTETGLTLQARERLLLGLASTNAVCTLMAALHSVKNESVIPESVTRYLLGVLGDSLIKVSGKAEEFKVADAEVTFSPVIDKLVVLSLCKLLIFGATSSEADSRDVRRTSCAPIAEFLISRLAHPQVADCIFEAFETILQQAVFANLSWRPGIRKSLDTLANVCLMKACDDPDAHRARNILALLTWKGIKGDSEKAQKFAASEWVLDHASEQLAEATMTLKAGVYEDECLKNAPTKIAASMRTMIAIVERGGNLPISNDPGVSGFHMEGLGGVKLQPEGSGLSVMTIQTSTLWKSLQQIAGILVRLVSDLSPQDPLRIEQAAEIVKSMSKFLAGLVSRLQPAKLALFAQKIAMILSTWLIDPQDPVVSLRILYLGGDAISHLIETITQCSPAVMISQFASTSEQAGDSLFQTGSALRQKVCFGYKFSSRMTILLNALRVRLCSEQGSLTDCVFLSTNRLRFAAEIVNLSDVNLTERLRQVFISICRIGSAVAEKSPSYLTSETSYESECELIAWLWRGLESCANAQGAGLTLRHISHSSSLHSGARHAHTATWLNILRYILVENHGEGLDRLSDYTKSLLGFSDIVHPLVLRTHRCRTSPSLASFVSIFSMWKDYLVSPEVRHDLSRSVTKSILTTHSWLADEIAHAPDWESISSESSRQVQEALRGILTSFSTGTSAFAAEDVREMIKMPEASVEKPMIKPQFQSRLFGSEDESETPEKSDEDNNDDIANNFPERDFTESENPPESESENPLESESENDEVVDNILMGDTQFNEISSSDEDMIGSHSDASTIQEGPLDDDELRVQEDSSDEEDEMKHRRSQISELGNAIVADSHTSYETAMSTLLSESNQNEQVNESATSVEDLESAHRGDQESSHQEMSQLEVQETSDVLHHEASEPTMDSSVAESTSNSTEAIFHKSTHPPPMTSEISPPTAGVSADSVLVFEGSPMKKRRRESPEAGSSVMILETQVKSSILEEDMEVRGSSSPRCASPSVSLDSPSIFEDQHEVKIDSIADSTASPPSVHVHSLILDVSESDASDLDGIVVLDESDNEERCATIAGELQSGHAVALGSHLIVIEEFSN